MSTKIQQAQRKSYKEILSSTVSLHIPTFQRAYNWKPKQILQLWQSVIDNQNQYYIGNIVVAQHSTENIQSGYLIIDGQQRLTTLSLFLVAIRDYVLKDKEKEKKKQQLQKHDKIVEDLNSSLVYSTPFSEEQKMKLLFTKRNLLEIYKRIVYRESLDKTAWDNAQQRFIINLNRISQLLREHLRDVSSEKTIKNAIQELVNKILQLEFIVIECRDESDAYQIFEGLNSTGLELSVVDLVKNSVFKKIQSDSLTLETAEKIWESMENDFEQTKLNLFPKFLRHQWISKYGYINNSQLYDAIKFKLDKEMSGSADVLDYIRDMKEDAQLYIALRTADLEYFRRELLKKNSDVVLEKYLRSFELLDSDQIFEVLLAYCKKYKVADKYTKNQFINDLRNIWNLGLMIKVIASVNPSKYEKLFADRCKTLAAYNGKEYDRESAKFYGKLWDLVKDRKEEFVVNFNELLVYKKNNDKNNELIRFLLLTMYQKLNEQKGVTYEVKTVEHILPQSKFESEDFLHQIGNLTILSREMNKKAGDRDFKTKYKEYYSKDIFEHNQRLNQYPFEEDPNLAISQRAKDLADEAFRVFSFKQ